MPRDAQILRILRDATREAARNLDNLKLVKPERNPEIAGLRRELDRFLLKHYAALAAEARSASSRAKASSRRHRLQLEGMKKVAEEAAENVIELHRRHCHYESESAWHLVSVRAFPTAKPLTDELRRTPRV